MNKGQIVVTWSLTIGSEEAGELSGYEQAIQFLSKMREWMEEQPEVRWNRREFYEAAERESWGNPLAHVSTRVVNVADFVAQWNAYDRFGPSTFLHNVDVEEIDKTRARGLYRMNSDGATAAPRLSADDKELRRKLISSYANADYGVHVEARKNWLVNLLNHLDGAMEDGLIDPSMYEGIVGQPWKIEEVTEEQS